jgi:hypothetical protein
LCWRAGYRAGREDQKNPSISALRELLPNGTVVTTLLVPWLPIHTLVLLLPRSPSLNLAINNSWMHVSKSPRRDRLGAVVRLLRSICLCHWVCEFLGADRPEVLTQ